MKALKEPLERSNSEKELREKVSTIIDDVRQNGDAALKKYSAEFDKTSRTVWRVSLQEIEDAKSSLTGTELSAMKAALKNISDFAQAQFSSISELKDFSPLPGLTMGHKKIPVDAALCYVPGGVYPLYSTALMLVTPAKIAGVPRIAACSPVVKGTASINNKTLAALSIAGASEIYALGGVQAIAAFAYGTEQINPVDLIVGPGNSYVAEAKRQCYGQVGIDFVAGPSEVMIIADKDADPRLIACDLLAQSEHDPLAQGILVTTDEDLGKKVLEIFEFELKTLETAGVAGASWRDFGAVYLVSSIEEAVDFANKRAPEHLELNCAGSEKIAEKLRNYGSLFIGQWAAEVFGDYAAGPNHTLPTLKAARYTGGVWAGTFLKTLTWQSANRQAAAVLSPLVQELALGEGLAAHARAAAARC
ncbi:histidinol dehydrogenase [Spirochaetia bacterium]|nr:histidinol dehydrogenase [Spirochaetia bacterium]